MKVLDLPRAVPQLPTKGDITDAYELLGRDNEKTIAMLEELERTTDALKPELPCRTFTRADGSYIIKWAIT